MPGISGIQAIPKIKKAVRDVQIIMLTVYESEDCLFDALSNGAAGFMTKNADAGRVIESIIEVMDGGGPMSMKIARMVIASFQKNQDAPLSKRETQVLEHIAEGKGRGRIANELFKDLETVKTHVKNIYFKLNVHYRADAITAAKKNRFI